MAALPELRSASFHRKWEFAAKHNLSASAAETLPLTELLAMAAPAEREDWDKLTLGYIETRGTLGLRSAIASNYQTLSADDLLMFSGGKDALFATFHALLEADDHVVVVTPNYQPLETIPLSIAKVSAVSLRPENGWRLSLDDMKAALRPQTRLICINFPHNPTGAILDPETFDGLVKLADDRNIIILSDEVYRGLESNPVFRRPAIADVYRRGLSLNVLSKAWGLAGLRIGWIAGKDRELLDRIEGFQAYLSDGNAGPSDILARIAMLSSDRIIARNIGIIDRNRRLLDEFFAQHAEIFEWQPPDAGCIGFPRYTGHGSADDFCENLLKRAGIALIPSSIYSSQLAATPSDRFRIGFGKRSFADGIKALSAFLDSG
jgi:aspartate/methionine/tyrosine aminotransferase